MIIVGFDKDRELFLNAAGYITDAFVLDLLLKDSYSDFEVVFSSDALMASVVRFSERSAAFNIELEGVKG